MNQSKNNPGRSKSVRPFLSLRSDSGQLAVGLAFAFVGILAMFGLVFNSSMNTREKMKLQTTSDYAALVAANDQRFNLNFINGLNTKIETLWLETQAALFPAFCTIPSVSTEGGGGTLVPLANGQLLSGVTTTTIGLNYTHKTYEETECEKACDDYDQFRRNEIIDNFNNIRNMYASAILTSIEQANGIAFDDSLYTFLAPSNLPHNLYVELENKFGGSLSIENVKNEYNKGGLTTSDYAYEIMEENKNDPLFIPQNESRNFVYPDYIYETSTCGAGVNEFFCCTGGYPGPLPKTSISNSRITRATDYTTHFYTGIRYAPPKNIIEKMFNVGVKQPDTQDNKFGQDVEDVNGKLELFQRRTKEIQAVSAAKPYGGTFPVSAFVADVSGLSGSSGTDFKGAKLIGIADSQEIGDQRIDRADSCLDQVDEYGNVVSSVCYKAEDFLH